MGGQGGAGGNGWACLRASTVGIGEQGGQGGDPATARRCSATGESTADGGTGGMGGQGGAGGNGWACLRASTVGIGEQGGQGGDVPDPVGGAGKSGCKSWLRFSRVAGVQCRWSARGQFRPGSGSMQTGNDILRGLVPDPVGGAGKSGCKSWLRFSRVAGVQCRWSARGTSTASTHEDDWLSTWRHSNLRRLGVSKNRCRTCWPFATTVRPQLTRSLLVHATSTASTHEDDWLSTWRHSNLRRLGVSKNRCRTCPASPNNPAAPPAPPLPPALPATLTGPDRPLPPSPPAPPVPHSPADPPAPPLPPASPNNPAAPPAPPLPPALPATLTGPDRPLPPSRRPRCCSTRTDTPSQGAGGVHQTAGGRLGR